jgi:hypothetical protein
MLVVQLIERINEPRHLYVQNNRLHFNTLKQMRISVYKTFVRIDSLYR